MRTRRRSLLAKSLNLYGPKTLNWSEDMLPLVGDDDVVIETRCTDLGAASCRMHQIAKRGDTPLCEATLRVGFISLEGRPRRQPAPWRAAFKTFMDQETA